MKRFAWAAILAASSLPAFPADVGVSISISQPGVYGRIDIGKFPQPAVIAAQPVIIARPAEAPPQPVYLWVPPGHQKHWSKHCHEYKACGTPVYFVRDDWYHDHVMRDQHEGERPGHDRDHGRDHGHDRRHDRDER